MHLEPGEVSHQVEEQTFLEPASLVLHLAEDRVDGVELLAPHEVVQEDGVRGAVVVEAFLLRGSVEEVERALRVSLAFDEIDGGFVGDELGFGGCFGE